MTNGVTVDGGAQLSRTLARASDDLKDMERAGDRAANLVANDGRREAPRLTGALASSITPAVDNNVASVSSALAYANRTHWGYSRYGQRAQPFLTDALARDESTITSYFADEADRVLHEVKGA